MRRNGLGQLVEQDENGKWVPVEEAVEVVASDDATSTSEDVTDFSLDEDDLDEVELVEAPQEESLFD